MKTKYIIAFLLVSLICITAFVVYAQESNVVFRYYGDELGSDDFQDYFSSHDEVHCVQVLTEYAFLYLRANLFECFDTIEEADAFAIANQDSNNQLEQDILGRIESGELEVPQVYSDFRELAGESAALRGVGYWVLYANAAYNGHLADVDYYTTNPNPYYTPPNTGIWSIMRQGNPIGIRLYSALCSPTFTLVYVNSDGFLKHCSMGGAGGTYAAQVIAP